MSNNLGGLLRRILELLIGAVVLLWEWLTGKQQHNDEHPLQYFVPGKIILHVDHPAGFDSGELADLINPILAQWGQGRIQELDTCGIQAFPLATNPAQAFSVVPVKLINTGQSTLVSLLVEIFNRLKDNPYRVTENVFIRAASPSWLLGNTSHAPTPTSPGSWPVKAPAPNPGERFLLLDLGNTALSPLASSSEDGTGIDVAIIDTAPADLDLKEAYEKWHRHYAPVETLLAPTVGKLHVYEGIRTVIELMEYSPVGHRYLMQDHGLFVASIVHSITPEAQLHLVKAFTPQGVASIETIAEGVQQILQRFRNQDDKNNWRPLIVNCSFGLTAPTPDEKTIPGFPPTDFPVELWDPKKLELMTTSLRELFTSLAAEKDVVIVAAAGNDSSSSRRRRTRFPAAYENVLGVGAVPTLQSTSTGSYTSATYSNRADDQNPDEGYVTLGGEPGPGNGIRGLYTSEIPVYVEGWLSFLWRIFTGTGLDGWRGPGNLPPNPRALSLDRIRYKKNKTGWVWWAGTSFATPIVSGFLAALWSGPCRGTPLNIPSAKTQLNNHIKARTPDGESVLHVEQRT